MKLITSQQAHDHTTSEFCIATEYSFEDQDITVAAVTINGRYPHKGRVVNERCKEVVFIMEGEGRVVIEGLEILIQKGDSVLIEAMERVYWEGFFTMLISCLPAWSMEQHKIIE